jgi:hypothetical protein
LFEQGKLCLCVGRTEGQDAPGQGQNPVAKRCAQQQHTPMIFKVSAIHHQTQFHTRPCSKQLMHQGHVTACLCHRLVVQPASNALDQILALSWEICLEVVDLVENKRQRILKVV